MMVGHSGGGGDACGWRRWWYRGGGSERTDYCVDKVVDRGQQTFAPSSFAIRFSSFLFCFLPLLCHF